MADLRIVDAPEIPTENITGEEKLPTGGSGNYSISLDSLADYTKTKKDLSDNTTVDNKVNGVRQELDDHIEDLLNPHQVTKVQIGLGNVDNTADADKPVSNSAQAAIISAVAPKADKTYVDTQLALKANKADVYTKQESSDLVNNSISTALTPVNSSLELAKRGIANLYDSSLTYNSGERVVLANGDIVKSTIDGNANDPNVDMTGWVNTNSSSQIFDESGLSQQEWNNGVESIEALRLLSPEIKGNSVNLASVSINQNEGGGRFVATEKVGLIDNGGTIVESANPNLFWVRVDYEAVTPEMFGYPINPNALQNAINHGYPVQLHQKEYRTTIPIELRNGLKITGHHPEYSRIVKSTVSTVNIDGIGDLDCAVYMSGTVSASKQIFIEGIGITKEQIVGADVGVGAYFRYTARSTFKNFWVLGGETAIKTYDTWMCNWVRCEGKAANAWDLNVGTSNTFEDCWAITGKQFAWKAFNLMYSSMINCGADYTGSDGSPAEAIYHFTGGSTVTMVGCASEHSHAYNLIYCNNSQVNVINGKHMQFHNKYLHSDVARRGIICVGDYEAVLNLSGGDYSAEYNDTTGGTYIPWGCAYRGALNSKDVRYSKSIFDIKSTAWGITALDYAWINYESNGLTQVIDNRSKDTSYNNHSYTERSFGFKSRTMKPTETLGSLRNGLDKFVFAQGLSDAPTFPDAPNKYHVINMSDYKGAGDASMFAQMAFNMGANHVAYRWGDAGYPSDPWIEFLTKANTTVDSNGFIKAASPIVRLFADRIEKNTEVSALVGFERLGVGDYLITGSNGFSDNGWYIETPKDANGNVLFSVVYTTLDNGDISVKAYSKKFDIETASIVADLENPVDITKGRWIDIRLN